MLARYERLDRLREFKLIPEFILFMFLLTLLFELTSLAAPPALNLLYRPVTERL